MHVKHHDSFDLEDLPGTSERETYVAAQCQQVMSSFARAFMYTAVREIHYVALRWPRGTRTTSASSALVSVKGRWRRVSHGHGHGHGHGVCHSESGTRSLLSVTQDDTHTMTLWNFVWLVDKMQGPAFCECAHANTPRIVVSLFFWRLDEIKNTVFFVNTHTRF